MKNDFEIKNFVIFEEVSIVLEGLMMTLNVFLQEKNSLVLSNVVSISMWHNTLYSPPTPSNSEMICGQNVGTKVVCGMILFFEKKAMLKI